VSTGAVGRESDGAGAVGPQYGHARACQAVEHFGGRVSVPVPPAHADDRHCRVQLGEPLGGRRRAGAVVAHLEHVDRPHPSGEPPFDRHSRVTREQHADRAVPHPQDHRVLVRVERGRDPAGVRTEHVERDAVHGEAVTRPGGRPRRPAALHLGEPLEVDRFAQRGPGLDDRPWVERPDHRREPAEVVGVAMARHHHRHPAHAALAQERHHHPPPRIPGGAAGAAIDHDPGTVGRSQQRGVALAHVEEMYGQARGRVEGNGPRHQSP
jgi:hypothetical protein